MSGDLATFSRFCSALTLEQGGALELEPFQRRMLADYFSGARETLVLISKKNGKTTLLAALALFHLLIEADAECVIGAASRDQATILYDQAARFVARSPGLSDRVDRKRGYRELRSTRDSGRIRVLAADVDTADGVIPTLALVDELGRHRSAELYGVFRDGLGPRGGQMIAISVAGDHEGSPLGVMRQAARQLPDVKTRGRYTVARSADRSYVMHEWALRPEDDVDDLRIVKQANPASWQTLELLAERRDSPSTMPWQWARFACGLWVAAEAWWLDAESWANASSDERIEDGEKITLGFDGARHGDATALLACRLSDGLLEPLGVWEAPVDAKEWEVPGGEVDAAIADAMERFRVVRGYFDPPLWQTEIDEWAREYGDPSVVKFWTNRQRMKDANERFRTDVVAGRVLHVGDERLTRHVLNAQIRETRGGYWLGKSRPGSPEKIDAAVAAVLAYQARADALSGDSEEEKKPGRLLTF
jgi:phage terminase large subunit-like protein